LRSAQLAYGGFPESDLGEWTGNPVLIGSDAPGAMSIEIICVRSIDDMLDLKFQCELS
jgi:hypothetical protein